MNIDLGSEGAVISQLTADLTLIKSRTVILHRKSNFSIHEKSKLLSLPQGIHSAHVNRQPAVKTPPPPLHTVPVKIFQSCRGQILWSKRESWDSIYTNNQSLVLSWIHYNLLTSTICVKQFVLAFSLKDSTRLHRQNMLLENTWQNCQTAWFKFNWNPVTNNNSDVMNQTHNSPHDAQEYWHHEIPSHIWWIPSTLLAL